MNLNILEDPVQDFIQKNSNKDVTQVILAGSPFNEITIQELAQQIQGRQKTKKKLPTWHKTLGIYYPPTLNLEQTSSEITAKYKASLFKNLTIADITGGLGIDSYFFSLQNKQVNYCEKNNALFEIAKHNLEVLKADNIATNFTDGIKFLKNTDKTFDLIYIDPSRRNDSKGKVFMLQDCEPNVMTYLDLFFAKAKEALIKTSPLLDISLGIEALPTTCAIYVIAVKNEVKELLWHVKPKAKDLTINAVNIQENSIDEVAINYREAITVTCNYDLPNTYLYEPNAALMKTGMFNWISEQFKLDKLHPNTHLYTASTIVPFPGRSFKIMSCIAYSKKNLKKYINKKANITTRNFKTSVQELRKKHKIKDGGDLYLFFTTDLNNKAIVLECTKL